MATTLFLPRVDILSFVAYVVLMIIYWQKLNKMKTFKEMNPIHSQLDLSVIDEFIDQQQQMLRLLERGKTTDLTRTKVSISISKWIKLRLGDTFRFVIYHNMRHIQQAKRVLEE